MAFTMPYAAIFWSVLAWVALGELRMVRRSERECPASAQDARSGPLIVAVMQVAMLIAFVAAIWLPSAAFGEELLPFSIGVGLMLAGGTLRRHSIRMLGRHFTVRVVVLPGQPLVQRGAYRWIRHPAYLGSLLAYAGLGLALANWLSAGVLMAGGIPVYLFRIAIEERALATTLGEGYSAYARRTKRLIPFVY